MPFGWVTRRELEARSDELRAEYQRALEDQRALVKRIQLEWEEWFDKFRRLYARINKRVTDQEAGDAKHAEAASGSDGSTSPASGHPINPAKLSAWRARRGF
jgi:hypothetical protein